METASTPLSQFLSQLQINGDLPRPLLTKSCIVFESDNAKVLPRNRSRTVRASTCVAGDSSRWESSSSHEPQIRRGVERTMSPQKPQRRGSMEMTSTASPPRKTSNSSPPRMPRRSGPSPTKAPTRRVLHRTLTPRKPQRRSSIEDLEAMDVSRDVRSSPQRMKVAPSA